MKTVALAFTLFLGGMPVALSAADAPGASAQPTLQLGTVEVQGNAKIVAALQAIKAALKAPFSDDPARADDPVCRIVKQLGETREYLDCATNRDHSRRRDATQTAIMINTYGTPTGTDLLRGLVALQPMHELRMPVNGGSLQALLARIPDAPMEQTAAPSSKAPKAAPAAATQEAPASATSPPATQWY